jgi:hypothetical protein
MAFSFDTMTAYVEENRADLISKAILGAKTLGLGVDIRSGIKSSEKIPVLESTVPFQAAACSFTSSGTTTFSQVSIATVGIQFAEQLCLNDLNTYFTQKYLPAGANIDSLSIAQQIIDRKIAQVARNVENMIWAGKTTYTNSTVLKQMNGWLSTIDTAGTAVAATPSTLNSTNVLTIFDDIYSKVPAAALVNEPVVAFCGYDTFRTLAAKITSTYGIYGSQYTTDNVWNNWELMYPGTNMKVIGVPGLSDTASVVETGSVPTAVRNRIIATYASNLVYGTDLQSDIDNIEAWWSKDDRVWKLYGAFRAGVAVKFIDHVVQYTNA